MKSRRNFLTGVAGAGLWTGLGLPGLGLPGLAFAAAPVDQRLLLVVLRGGMDGLAALPPYGEPHYASLRGKLAFAPPGREDGAIDLDGRFGLHPALRPLEKLYRRKELLPIHAVAIPLRTRSHFDAQDVLENGGSSAHETPDGWLNRALGALQGDDRRLGLAVGYATPSVMRGTVPVASWAPAKLPPSSDDLLDKLTGLYRDDPVFHKALAEGRRAKMMTASVMGGSNKMARGNLRSPGRFKTLAAAAGRLLAAADGPRIGVVEMGGWDTHANQGNGSGRLARNLSHLAEGLAQLPDQLGPAWDKTVVAVVSEFGRTVRVNGSGGSDHGTAGAAFLLGGAVAGGRVATRWPGLAPESLYENRDLAPTSDIRALFKTILGDHFGLDGSTLEDKVFPNSRGSKAPPGKLIRV
jgi:uncharacterized protein (DUF1501 family)